MITLLSPAVSHGDDTHSSFERINNTAERTIFHRLAKRLRIVRAQVCEYFHFRFTVKRIGSYSVVFASLVSSFSL